MSPVAQKGSKKAAKPEPLSSSTADPTLKSEPDNSSGSVTTDPKDPEKLIVPTISKTTNECVNSNESEFDWKENKALDRFPFAKEDMTLCPDGGPSSNAPFTLQRSCKNTPFHHTMPPCGIGLEGAPKPKSNTKPKKSSGAAFTAADLERYLFPVIHETKDSENVLPSYVAQSVQQARTEKLVKFFKDNINDKHFVPIPVEPLRGNENWREWLVAMQLLFIQHGIWEVVAKDIKPLPESHPLNMWYLRMRDCAVGLIYVNVSENVRKHECFLCAATENDPNAMINHLDAHYGMPDQEDSHTHAGLNSQRK